MLGALPNPYALVRQFLDVRLGFALMRDRRVPLRAKLMAVWIGLAVTALVEFLELPIEGLISALLPIAGAAGDLIVDGAEVVAGPVLLAAVLLPFLAPKPVVEEVRAQRSGRAPKGSGEPKGPIIDV